MAKRTKGKLSFGCLFWVLFVLLMAALFILNKDTIIHVFEKTNAKRIFTGKKADVESTADIPEIQLKDDTAAADDTRNTEAHTFEVEAQAASEQSFREADGEQTGPDTAEPTTTTANTVSTQQNDEQASIPDNAAAALLNSKTQQEQMGRRTASPEAGTTAAGQPEQMQTAATQEPAQMTIPIQKEDTPKPQRAEVDRTNPAETRQATLYWIRIDNDGKLTRQSSIRTIPKSATPMSDALEALFAMPANDELRQGYRTLIPPGTRLRSAWVKDGIAFINVSEEFQFNQYGIEGALGQLSQVVFTATEFPTVKKVQILIEGQKKDYLGAEGVWIGSPLSRVSF